MAFQIASKLFQCRLFFSKVPNRCQSFKSAINLENLYPNSTLKLSTPSLVFESKDKFSGFIPVDKLTITYSGSSGPGGQNVNKVHTKVDLRFKVDEADWLHPDVREGIFNKYKTKITKEGFLVVKSDVTRSQQLNLADCLNKLREIIRNSTLVKAEPSPETLEKLRKRHEKAARERLMVKRENSLRKTLKRPPTVVDL